VIEVIGEERCSLPKGDVRDDDEQSGNLSDYPYLAEGCRERWIPEVRSVTGVGILILRLVASDREGLDRDPGRFAMSHLERDQGLPRTCRRLG
jgi:hypothetical protein